MEQFKIRYTYDNPSRSGPFKGSTIVNSKHDKGDCIYAVMGRATVISCSKVRQVKESA